MDERWEVRERGKRRGRREGRKERRGEGGRQGGRTTDCIFSNISDTVEFHIPFYE